MEQQERDWQVRHSLPSAVVLEIVNNGPEHGWKWLVWDYDPDHVRAQAGAIEGIFVPHGMKSGFGGADAARADGLAAVRKTWMWSGDVVLREPVADQAVAQESP